MMMRHAIRTLLLVAPVIGCAAGCRATRDVRPLAGHVEYVGSSTVAVFVRQAAPVYGAIEFEFDTTPESLGGERLAREGRAELVGIAKEPDLETLEAGVQATLIGRDAIAIIVHGTNPVNDIPAEKLDDLFAGRVKNWKELGGPDLEVRPFIVAEESATREVFRSAILGAEDYVDCETISPDKEVINAVAANPGGLGHISFSLLEPENEVRAIAIGGERPDVTNFDYPISRPLYLLWRDDQPVVAAFVEWARSSAGQRIVMKDFVGNRVLGSASPRSRVAPGTLVVRTETFEFTDPENVFTYYPHRPYEIYDRSGRFLRRVPNHIGNRDESPTRVLLPPGDYLLRTETSSGEAVEMLATVETRHITEVDFEGFLGERPGGQD